MGMGRIVRLPRTPAGIIGVSAAAMLLAYAALRIPPVRDFLCGITLHRPTVEASMQRRLLAPRSAALAGIAGLGLLVFAMAWRRGRAAMLAEIPRARRGVGLVITIQSMLALALVVNLTAARVRRFGPEFGLIDIDRQLEAAIPETTQIDAEIIRGEFSEAKKIAFPLSWSQLETGGDAFLLNALIYPGAGLYDVDVRTTEGAANAREIGVTHGYRRRPNPFPSKGSVFPLGIAVR